jgi:hypothetical protein
MARDVREIVIGEHTYRLTLLGAKAGIAMSVRLLRMMGPTLASFVEGTWQAKGDGAASLVVGAAEAVREIAARLTAEQCAHEMAELAKLTVVVLDAEHEPRLSDVFDDHFSGHYDHLLGWLRFALEENFQSFFGGAGQPSQPGRANSSPMAALMALITQLASASPSPPASTGTSTASPPVASTARA